MRRLPLVVVAAVLAIAGCSPGSSAAVSPRPSESVDMCADNLPPVPAGLTAGELVGTIDRGRILFAIEATVPGTIALAYIDAGGLHVVPMPHDGTLAHPVWAPDGTIVFDTERAGNRHLFRVATDGSGLTQVTKEQGAAEMSASFSLDGSRIAYEHYSCVEERDFGIHIAASDGTGPVALNEPFPLHSRASEGDPAFSPDGETVAFVRSADDTHGALWVVPAAGGEARRLTSDDVGAAFPRWSPDGERILFGGRRSSSGAEDFALLVVAAGGGEPRRVLVPDGTMQFQGDWSPDGTKIVFDAYQTGWDHDELRIAASDGTQVRTLWVGNQSEAETPHWGP